MVTNFEHLLCVRHCFIFTSFNQGEYSKYLITNNEWLPVIQNTYWSRVLKPSYAKSNLLAIEFWEMFGT